MESNDKELMKQIDITVVVVAVYEEVGTSQRWYVLPDGTVLNSRARGNLELSIHDEATLKQLSEVMRRA